MVSEFGDAWSDDFIVLRDAREQFLTACADGNPTRVANAVFCRHLIISVVGAIEMTLRDWSERDQYAILQQYFAQKAKNSDRVRSLASAFQAKGFCIDHELFEDFLALKYLRNTIEHSAWKKDEKDHVEARGFRTNVTRFRLSDWDRIAQIYNPLAIYIGQTAHSVANRENFEKLAKILSE